MIVMDASVCVAELLDDESHSLSSYIFSGLADGTLEVVVPPLFHLEVGNAILSSLRRRRISLEQAQEYITTLGQLPFKTEETGDMQAIALLATAHGLSMYDASYLELAVRRNILLASLDKRLVAAAKACRVSYAPS